MARERISKGYYHVEEREYEIRSLKGAITNSRRNAIIAEVKFASPSAGRIAKNNDLNCIISEYVKGGAIGISVLTEPSYFEGDISFIPIARKLCDLPLLMKDIIVSPIQVKAAKYSGADAILLISSLYKQNKDELSQMIRYAHKIGLEVLLETNNREEFLHALDSEADIIGINNRDMKNLEVKFSISRELLKLKKGDKPVVCESGISSPEQVAELKSIGADAFLVGTALMSSDSPSTLLKRLVSA